MNSIGDMVKHHSLGLIKIVLIQIVFFAMYVFLGLLYYFILFVILGPAVFVLSFAILGPLLGFIPTVMAVETLKGLAAILIPTVGTAFLIIFFVRMIHNMMVYKVINSWTSWFDGSARRSASHSSSMDTPPSFPARSETSEPVPSAIQDTNVVPSTYPHQKCNENDQILLPRSTSSADASLSNEVKS